MRRWMVLACAFVTLNGAVALGCKRTDPQPPPEPVKTGPSAEDVAKWTKIRSDYEASAKANGTRQDVVTAMLALIDAAKASGDEIFFGILAKKNVEHGDMDWDGALGLATNANPMDLSKDCSIDARTKAEPISLFGGDNVQIDHGIQITSVVGENPEPLHLSENGSAREVRQIQLLLTVKIAPPTGAAVVVERKLDVSGFSMSGMIQSGMVFSKRGIYEHQLTMLHDRACVAIHDILGLRDLPAK